MTGMAAAAGSHPQWRTSIRHLGLTAAVVTTSIAVVTVAGTARQEPASSIARHLPVWLLVLGLIGAASVTSAGWAVWAQHPRARSGWRRSPVAPSSRCGRDGPAGGPSPVPPSWPRPHLPWPGRLNSRCAGADSHRSGLLLAVVYALTAAAVGIHFLGYDPFADPACRRTCIEVHPLARGVVDTRAAVTITCLLTIAAAGLATVEVLRIRPVPAPRPIVVGALGALALLAVSAAVRWASWGDPGRSESTLLLPPFAAATLVGATVLFVAVNTRRTRVAVDRLIARLSDHETGWRDVGGAVRGVHFAVPDDGRWVDPSGHAVHDQPESRRCVVMSDESGPVFRLLLTGDKEAIDVLGGLTPATQLSLRNAQLAAVTRARLADVKASRRRVVATSDAERERIEHDLHDGAQQRLVSAAFYLSVARGRLPDHLVPVERAETLVRDALAHLRRLAHGIFPTVLATEGLGAALDELVRSTDVPATLDVSGADDVDAEIAMAAYATVVTALSLAERTSPAECARIAVERRGKLLEHPCGGCHRAGTPVGCGLYRRSRSGRCRGWTTHRVVDRRPNRGDRGASMRVVVADDVMLVRSGLARLLSDAGVEVVGEAAEADGLLRLVALEQPDAAVVDIRMPPTHTDEGLVAARRIREHHPTTAVVLLSQYLEPRYAERLLSDQPGGLGYLLKERVSDIAVLVDALQRVGEGECVIDPTIVNQLMRRRRPNSPLERLTEREQEILGLMAEGRSNSGIARHLGISERTVEAASAQVFQKLDLEPSPDVNRRVLAVLTLLRT